MFWTEKESWWRREDEGLEEEEPEPAKGRKKKRKKKAKRPLSDFWAQGRRSWFGWVRGDDKLFSYMQGLQTVSKIGRIVFPAGVRFSWSRSTPLHAATHVTLNPEPIDATDIEWSEAERVDALVGNALSRAGEAQFVRLERDFPDFSDEAWRLHDEIGRDGIVDLLHKTLLTLYNASAYIYTERRTVEQFPGYGGYFAKEREFAHRDSVRSEAELVARLDLMQSREPFVAATMAVMWQALDQEFALGVDELDVPLAGIAAKMRAAAQAVTHPNGLFEVASTATEEIARLILLDEPPEQEPEPDSEDGEEDGDEKQSQSQGGGESGNPESDEGEPDEGGQDESEQGKDRSDESRPDKGKKELDPDAAHNEIDGAARAIGMDASSRSEAGLNRLDDEKAAEVTDAVEREYRLTDLRKELIEPNPPAGIARPKMYSIKGEISRTGYNAALQSIRSLVAKTRAGLLFRNNESALHEYNLRRGRLDEAAIFKLSFNDPKVFREVEIVGAPKVDIGILVDESGSMSNGLSSRSYIARRCTILLAEALRGIRGVSLSVWGHTGNWHMRGADGALVFRYIENGVGDVNGLGDISGRGNNYDSWAINWVVKRMLDVTKNEHKILFVLCDGKPAGQGYGQGPAMDHVNQIVKAARRHGVEVFALGMGSDLRGADLERMYGKGRWMLVPDPKDLPNVVAKLMRQALRAGTI
jgi:hypothetical protein